MFAKNKQLYFTSLAASAWAFAALSFAWAFAAFAPFTAAAIVVASHVGALWL